MGPLALGNLLLHGEHSAFSLSEFVGAGLWLGLVARAGLFTVVMRVGALSINQRRRQANGNTTELLRSDPPSPAASPSWLHTHSSWQCEAGVTAW